MEKQLLRMLAYSVHFMFRENSGHLSARQWFPFAWERGDADEESPVVDEEERKRLQEMIRQENERLRGER